MKGAFKNDLDLNGEEWRYWGEPKLKRYWELGEERERISNLRNLLTWSDQNIQIVSGGGWENLILITANTNLILIWF